MRPKIVFGLALSALLVIGAALFWKRHPGTPVAATATAPIVEATAPLPAPVSAAPAVAPVLTDEERQAAIDAEIDRLGEWSRKNDAQSLSNILADLTNSEKDVREAAIEATKQFGSSNAIPALKAAAMADPDTEEQIDMLQAANFLSLPQLGFNPATPDQIQAAEQRRAQMQQSHAPKQNPQQQSNAPAGQ